MKIASLWLDDIVVVPGGRELGGDHRTDLRDASFHASEGWQIHETSSPGVFTVQREGMTDPVIIGGYGYSYVKAADESKRGKRG